MIPEKTILTINIPGLKLFRKGKVRDIFDAGDRLIFVATDRVSAFDVILPDGIPGKGEVLTAISTYWFKVMEDIIPNHLISTDIKDFPPPCQSPGKLLAGRTMLVKKAKPIPVECVVRGYISGSAWKEYKKDKKVCGISLPDGLLESGCLPEPIFTPSTKAEEGHDMNITFEEMEEMIGSELSKQLKDKSLAIYNRAREIALKKGFIIADTKFEFGLYEDKLMLIDEILTPDSSRFWSIKTYQPGKNQDSYDKQIIRDYLISIGWDKNPPAPELPEEIVEKTSLRYREIMSALLQPA